MGLFRKKKKEEIKIFHTDYTNWEKDLGFLTLLMVRKKNVTKNFYINIYATQLKDTDYVRDEDLEPIIMKSVEELINDISGSYKEFLISKYFGTQENLIRFVTEDFYVELTGAAVVQNFDKIKSNQAKKRLETVSRMNKQIKDEDE